MSKTFEVSPSKVYWAVVVALCTSTVFFVYSVETRRKAWTSDKELNLTNGEAVQFLQVIDGDEASVKHKSGTFLVRLLGIKAFNPKANEPGLSGLGAQAAQALERILSTSKPISIHFQNFKKDRSGRVLAFLSVGEIDVGQQLIKDGFVVAYTRYPTSKEDLYLAAELEAQTRKKGLWANSKAVSRIQGWKGSWEAQRHDP